MAEQHRPDDLAPLYAELAALRAEVRRKRAPRRWLPLVLVALLVVLVPLAGLAAGPTFTDLNAGSVHNANIQAIADAGITTGCDPGVSYCPNGLVTREEMASFLARTAGLGSNPPVVNAATAQTATSATTATTATNATQLGGQPASFYQAAGQPITNATNAVNAQNANTVGNYAPNALVRVTRADDGHKGASFPEYLQAVPVDPLYKTFVTLTIVAPQAGFILVSGQAFVLHFNSASDIISVCARHTENGETSVATESYLAVAGETVGLTWAFPVAAGTQTFVLEATAATDTTWRLGRAALTATYVPFGYDGGPTLAP